MAHPIGGGPLLYSRKDKIMNPVVDRSIVSKTGFTGNHQLIQDSIPFEINRREPVIVEDVAPRKGVSGTQSVTKGLRLGGRFQFANRPNANGRIYEFDTLREAVEEIQGDIKGRRVLGEFDHPPDAKIHLDRISHVMTKLWMEDDEVFGEIEVLPKMQMGGQLQALVESDVSIGISSRGVGDMDIVEYNGEQYNRVLPGYTIVTFDVVAEPSVHGSYLSVMESRERARKSTKSYFVMESRVEQEKKVIAAVRNALGR